MAIEKLGAVVSRQVMKGASAPKFSETLLQSPDKGASAKAPVPSPNAFAKPKNVSGATSRPAQVLERVTAAQNRMDRMLQLASSGRTFSPAELLALQTQVCTASQEVDLFGKAVDKAVGGVKQVLQTQI